MGADLLPHLLQIVQTVGQLDGAADGEDVIHEIQAEEERGHRDGVGGADVEQPRHHRRIHNMAQQHAGQTEQQAVLQTDAAVELDLLAAVIPPAHMEDGLHKPAGEVLQRRGQRHARQKGQQGIFQAPV